MGCAHPVNHCFGRSGPQASWRCRIPRAQLEIRIYVLGQSIHDTGGNKPSFPKATDGVEEPVIIIWPLNRLFMVVLASPEKFKHLLLISNLFP